MSFLGERRAEIGEIEELACVWDMKVSKLQQLGSPHLLPRELWSLQTMQRDHCFFQDKSSLVMLFVFAGHVIHVIAVPRTPTRDVGLISNVLYRHVE